jgi:Mor family transcriptional regulator
MEVNSRTGPKGSGSEGAAYSNAAQVLPPTLLSQVQKHFDGGLLWVPARARRRAKTRDHVDRNRRIVDGHRRGISVRVLAERYALSRVRIRQILREAKENV